MKKTIPLSCLLFIICASVLFAPPVEKAEKLRHEDNGWDKDGQQFVISMSCKFGQATAGEHANFTVRTELTINAAGKTYQKTGVSGIQKVEGATKDADGFVKIEPTTIKWDSEGFEGVAKTEASINLIGPSGKPIGDAVTTKKDVLIEPPSGGPDDSTS